MLSDQNSSGFKLRLEHLDDFAVFDSDDNVVSLHQVKATVSKYRSSYEGALSQASKIYSQGCDGNTKRYFHVSTNIDDFKDYGEGESLVTFYKNHVNDQYIDLDDIENYIKEMIDLIEPPISTKLTLFRYNKLLSLIDSRVNYIHAVNQKTSSNQFEATDQNPISFDEIKAILNSEYQEDTVYFLELFRRGFIDKLDEFAKFREQSSEYIIDLVECKKAISILGQEELQRLYFSFDPTNENVSNHCSNNDLGTYMGIICTLDKLITDIELPHYRSFRATSFLPTGFSLDNLTAEWRLQSFKNNIEHHNASAQLKYLFFDYDNFIISMSGKVEHKPIPINVRFTHASRPNDSGFNQDNFRDREQGNITRQKAVRFVSAETAKQELNEN